MTRSTATALLALVATIAVVVSAAARRSADAAESGADATTSIRFDDRRAADVLRRTERRTALSDLLRQVATIKVSARVPSRLVLHVYRMRGKEVVRRYTSTTFDAPARGEILLRDVLGAGEPRFGRFVFEPDHLVEAVESIPAGPAVDDASRFIINGVIPFHPKGWESMETFYIVAVPADRRQASRASVDIGVVFATSE